MGESAINQVVILGGGTAGWMVAAALSRYFEGRAASITLVESETIGTVGVGEATIPSIREFNASLGIDELDFIRATGATFKLGIEFCDWHRPGDCFFHPFADFGQPLNGVAFHHYIRRLQAEGVTVRLDDYCFAIQLARRQRFAQPHEQPPTPLAAYGYAYHFDASRYADYLRAYAQARGVVRREGRVAQVQQNSDSGFIEALQLEDGATIEGQLFIDCSGFRGLLIEQTLKAGHEDWRQWLPCDSAVAAPSAAMDSPPPYTRCTALDAGWQWRIPLQARTGNGYVYSQAFISNDRAQATLLAQMGETPLQAPRQFHFVAGPRRSIWEKNCFALGLASGFLEPLESTSISLIQTGIAKLLRFFPESGFHAADRAEVNRQHRHEFERIRDFLVLHYKATTRDDTEFWRYCRDMPIPDSLEQKMALFEHRGEIVQREPEAFEPDSWLAIYTGMGKLPAHYDVRADRVPLPALQQELEKMRTTMADAAEQAMSHRAFIDRHCREGQ